METLLLLNMPCMAQSGVSAAACVTLRSTQGEGQAFRCAAADKVSFSACRCGQGSGGFHSARAGSRKHDHVLSHTHWHRQDWQRAQRHAECERAQLHRGFPGHSACHSGVEVGGAPSSALTLPALPLVLVGTAPVVLGSSQPCHLVIAFLFVRSIKKCAMEY